MHLDHVRLLVVDFEACFRFYRDVMGLRVTWGEERDTYASYVSEGGTQLSLFKREVQAKALGMSNLHESAFAPGLWQLRPRLPGDFPQLVPGFVLLFLVFARRFVLQFPRPGPDNDR